MWWWGLDVVERMNSWAIPGHFIMSSYLLMFEGTLVRRLKRGVSALSLFIFVEKFLICEVYSHCSLDGEQFIDTTLYPKQEIVYFKTPQGLSGLLTRGVLGKCRRISQPRLWDQTRRAYIYVSSIGDRIFGCL